MGPLDQLIHLLNFFAPAWGVAFFCVVFAQLAARRWLPESRWGWMRQWSVNAFVGSLVLIAGLVWWGVDGKMATYGVLVLACASVQWTMSRGWYT
jgi:hypothetical protein